MRGNIGQIKLKLMHIVIIPKQALYVIKLDLIFLLIIKNLREKKKF